MHYTVGGLQALDRCDRAALDLGRQGETAQDTLAIDVNRTGTALSLIAALLRSGQIGVLAKRVEQRRSYIELEVMAFAIDLKR
jgi:non-ribosomal peptide synthetase component E (peptide arylation enzyme)